jgi:hypothetical protein
MALSTPSWNNSYYLNVLPKLIEMGATGDGCVQPKLEARFLNWGSGISPFRFSNQEDISYTFSQDFISDYNALPLDPEGDWVAYIAFCDMYGYRFPVRYSLGSVSVSLTVQDRFGDTTNFLFGITGNDTYFSEPNCTDPVPTSFTTEGGFDDNGVQGWDKIIQYTNVITKVAFNFVEFYQIYPVSSEPLGIVPGPLLSEQLFTYEPPPPGDCTFEPVTPTAAPTSGGATAIGMTLASILGLVGTAATVLY